MQQPLFENSPVPKIIILIGVLQKGKQIFSPKNTELRLHLQYVNTT